MSLTSKVDQAEEDGEPVPVSSDPYLDLAPARLLEHGAVQHLQGGDHVQLYVPQHRSEGHVRREVGPEIQKTPRPRLNVLWAAYLCDACIWRHEHKTFRCVEKCQTFLAGFMLCIHIEEMSSIMIHVVLVGSTGRAY